MNPDTKHIARFDTPEEARAAGYTVPLNTPHSAPAHILCTYPRGMPKSSEVFDNTAAHDRTSTTPARRFKCRARVSR